MIRIIRKLNLGPVKVMNKGTGAGGANTNKSGKAFEELTNNIPHLLASGFVKKEIGGKSGKYNFYLEKVFDEQNSIIYLTQTAFNKYFELHFNKKGKRNPDEAYLIKKDGKYKVKIIEKKVQNSEGSVIEKLQLGSYLLEEYSHYFNLEFEFAYCINDFLKEKYNADEFLRLKNEKHGIRVFFGNDANYFTQLNDWINTSFVRVEGSLE